MTEDNCRIGDSKVMTNSKGALLFFSFSIYLSAYLAIGALKSYSVILDSNCPCQVEYSAETVTCTNTYAYPYYTIVNAIPVQFIKMQLAICINHVRQI